eukprot:TRINITY_DN4495_c0_g1_i1.p2 TRINITY_DN4495_c0_g1~~TRINITY_DN4495_c0_g1_i1.p2  ORF type:complete len:308 (-),score=76.49 TRINITY_DN4495_c0_g1_i1:1164-2087(-)
MPKAKISKSESVTSKPKTIEKKKKESEDDVVDTDFSEPQVSEGDIKLVSWNVASFNTIQKKSPSLADYIREEDPFLIFLNETKIDASKVKENHIPGYHAYFFSCDYNAGYAGTGLFSKVEPIEVTYGIGIAEHDNEGRTITAEYDDFIIVGCYVPNSGAGLKRLDYRMEWDVAFSEYLNKLKEKKPVILCGDLNVAHQEIDLKNPKTNKKTAGFTDQERNNFSEFLNTGFVDSYRMFHPDETDCYTFWSYRGGCRKRNTGWRLDYFICSQNLFDEDRVTNSYIRKHVMGSDHCPIVMHLTSNGIGKN